MYGIVESNFYFVCWCQNVMLFVALFFYKIKNKATKCIKLVDFGKNKATKVISMLCMEE